MSGRVNDRTRLAQLSIVIALAGAACAGESDPDQVFGPPARPESCDAPHIVYMNGSGGTYSFGEVSDSVANTSSASWFEPKDREVTLGRPNVTDAEWEEAVLGAQYYLEPFNVLVTDADPGDRDHIEIAVVPDLDLIGCVAAVVTGLCAASDCSAHHRGVAFLNGTQMNAYSLGYEAALSVGWIAGLAHVDDDCDLMTNVDGTCSDQFGFLDEELPCTDEQGTPASCRCTGEPTQSSYQTLMEFFGPRCEE